MSVQSRAAQRSEHEELALGKLFVRYVRRGDTVAMAAVFDACAPRLLSVAVRLTPDPNEAEDLVQDAFLTAIEVGVDYCPNRPLMPWLLGILTNRARLARRVRDRQKGEAQPRLDMVEPVDVAADRELRSEVARVIDGLSQPYRGVMILHLQHGLSPVQVARALDRSAGTVRSQIARGLAMLRESLPKGFVAGVAVMPFGKLSGRGLDAVRDVVLGAATVQRAALIGSWFLWVTWSMKKIVGVAVACCVFAFLGWVGLAALGGEQQPDNSSTTETRAAMSVPDALNQEASPERIALSGMSRALPRLLARLVDREGQPIEGIEVGYVMAEVSEWRGTGDVALGEGALKHRSERDGRIEVPVAAQESGFLVLADAELSFLEGEGQCLRIYGALQDLDLGDLTVVRAGRVHGVVTDERGVAIVAASVMCVPFGRPGFGFMPRFRQLSGADGNFVFTGVGVGPFVLAVETPGFTVAEKRLYITAGEDTEAVLVVLKRGIELSGRIVDDAGAPVAGAIVHPVRDRNYGQVRVRAASQDGSVKTSADGTFRLGGLLATIGSVQVSAPGHVHQQAYDIEFSEGVEVVLQRTSRMHGRVIDAAGRPVKGVEVRFGEGSDFGIGGVEKALTDAEGRFSIDTLADKGDLRVDSEVVGLYANLPGQVVDCGDVRMPTRGDLTVSVVAGDLPLEGALVSLHRWPQKGIQEKRRDLDREEAMRNWAVSRKLAGGRTDARGRVVLSRLKPGRYLVGANYDGLICTTASVVEVITGERGESLVELDIGAFADVQVVYSDGRPARGRKAVLSGKGLANQSAISGSDGWIRFGPLVEGVYEVKTYEADMEYHVLNAVVTLSSIADPVAKQSVRVSTGGSVRVELRLPPYGAVRGIVSDAMGPAVGARVVMRRKNSDGRGMGKQPAGHTNTRGEFGFEDLPPGTYLLSWSGSDASAPSQRGLEVRAGETEVIDCRLAESVVRGRLLQTGNGAAVAGGTLAVYTAGDRMGFPRLLTRVGEFYGDVQVSDQFKLSRTGSDGRVEAKGIPAGVAELVIRAPGYLRQSFERDVPAQGLDLGDLYLVRAAKITGLVQTAAGNAASKSRLYYRRQADGAEEGAEEGEWLPCIPQLSEFVLPDLEPGTYEIRAALRASGESKVFGEIVRVRVAAGATKKVVVRLP